MLENIVFYRIISSKCFEQLNNKRYLTCSGCLPKPSSGLAYTERSSRNFHVWVYSERRTVCVCKIILEFEVTKQKTLTYSHIYRFERIPVRSMQ